VEITPESIQRYLDKHVPPENHELIREDIKKAVAAATATGTDPSRSAGPRRGEWPDEQLEKLASQIVLGLILSMSTKEIMAVTDHAHRIAKRMEKDSHKKDDPRFGMEVDALIVSFGLVGAGKKVDFILPEVFRKMRELVPGAEWDAKDATLKRRYFTAKKSGPKRSVRKKR
jgi:hypothetical protein